jgi:hypothetical protein
MLVTVHGITAPFDVPNLVVRKPGTEKDVMVQLGPLDLG